jgi:hypothetical protein
MRKLPKATYGKNKHLDRIDADGVFDTCKKTIEIRKGMPWNEEMRVFIHEMIHWVETQYKGKIVSLNDCPDLNKNEADRISRIICRKLVKQQYRKLFR